MRANYNRQARRVAVCTRARGPHGHRRTISPGRAWLTAYGRDLARLAERIKYELPPELVDLLSPAGLPPPASPGSRRQSSPEGRTFDPRKRTGGSSYIDTTPDRGP